MSEEKTGRKPIPAVLVKDSRNNPYFPKVGFEAVVDPVTLEPILGTIAKEDASHFLNLHTAEREDGNERTYISSITTADGKAKIKIGSLDAFIAPHLPGIKRGEKSLQPSSQIREMYEKRGQNSTPLAPSDLTELVTSVYASEDGVLGYTHVPIEEVSSYVVLDAVKQIKSGNILDKKFLSIDKISSIGRLNGATNQVVKEVKVSEEGEMTVHYGVSEAETYLAGVNRKFEETKRDVSEINEKANKLKEDLKRLFDSNGRPSGGVTFLDDYISKETPVRHKTEEISDPSDPTLKDRMLNDIRIVKEGTSYKLHTYYSPAPDLSLYMKKGGIEYTGLFDAIRKEKEERLEQISSVMVDLGSAVRELRQADGTLSSRIDDLSTKIAPLGDVAAILEQNARIAGKYNAVVADVSTNRENIKKVEQEVKALKENDKLKDGVVYLRADRATSSQESPLDPLSTSNSVVTEVSIDKVSGAVEVKRAPMFNLSEYAKTSSVADLVGDALDSKLPEVRDELKSEFPTKEEVTAQVMRETLASSVEVIGEDLPGDPSDIQTVKSVSVKNDLDNKRKLVVEFTRIPLKTELSKLKDELTETIKTKAVDLELHVNGEKVEGEGTPHPQGKTFITSAVRLLKRGTNGLTIDVKEEEIDLSAVLNLNSKMSEVKKSVKEELKGELSADVNLKVQEVSAAAMAKVEKATADLTATITNKARELNSEITSKLGEAKAELITSMDERHRSLSGQLEGRVTRTTEEATKKIEEITKLSEKFKTDVAGAITELQNAGRSVKSDVETKINELNKLIGEVTSIKDSTKMLQQQVTNELASLSALKVELAKVNVLSVANELKRDTTFTDSLKGPKGDNGVKGDAPILFVSGSGDSAELRYKYSASGETFPVPDENGGKFLIKNLKGAKGEQGVQGNPGTNGNNGESAYEIAKRTGRTTATSESEWITTLKGENGKNIQLTTSDGQVKWRVAGEVDYNKLYDIPAIDSMEHITSGVNKGRLKYTVAGKEHLVSDFNTEDLRGKNPKFRKNETHIQYRYSDNDEWNDLVALADLKGDKGEQGQQGAPGANGLPGAKGEDGAKGENGKDGARGVRFFWSKGVYKTNPSDVVASINPNFLELEKVADKNEVTATFLNAGVTQSTETLIEGDNLYNPETLDVFTLKFDSAKKSRFVLSYVTNIRGLKGDKGSDGERGPKGDNAVIPQKIMDRLKKIAEGNGESSDGDNWGVEGG